MIIRPYYTFLFNESKLEIFYLISAQFTIYILQQTELM